MHLLLYDACSYVQNDIMSVLSEMGITYKNIIYKLKDISHDDFFCFQISQFLDSELFDAVFSINYYPILAKVCYQHNIRYIAWSYDSPLNIPHIEDTLGLSTNHIFFFDRIEWNRFYQMGFETVHHLPLGINVSRLSNIVYSSNDHLKYSTDISFVGHLYQPNFQALLYPLNEYQKGFLDSIVESQLRIYGCYFVNNLVTDELIEQLGKQYLSQGFHTLLTKEGLSIAIAKQIARTERLVLLSTFCELGKVKFYSNTTDSCLSNVEFCGSVNYYTEMPLAFYYSKINLCPAIRCIESGIPLRAIDIMGSGGFLLSNYQTELAEQFEIGTELELYSSLEEAWEKAAFYLEHEELRNSIALKGRQKVFENFSYTNRIAELLSVSGLLP